MLVATVTSVFFEAAFDGLDLVGGDTERERVCRPVMLGSFGTHNLASESESMSNSTVVSLTRLDERLPSSSMVNNGKRAACLRRRRKDWKNRDTSG